MQKKVTRPTKACATTTREFSQFSNTLSILSPVQSYGGKNSSSKFCISDFRIEIYTQFWSRKHVLFLFLRHFTFPHIWQSNRGQISNLVLRKLINLSAWHQITESCSHVYSFQDNLESWSYKLTMTHWLCVTSLTREFKFHHYNTLPSWLLHHNNALILYSTYLQKYIFPLNLPLFLQNRVL